MLKPDDLKAKALRHFKNPIEGRITPPNDLMALCQSNFERDVLARAVELGYRVRPQVKVGPYSIDLVIEGHDDRRLAIELDGDQYHGPERWAGGSDAATRDGTRRLAVLAMLGIKFPSRS